MSIYQPECQEEADFYNGGADAQAQAEAEEAEANEEKDFIDRFGDGMERLTIKGALWRVVNVLDVPERIKVLREIADDIEAEVNTFGESK